MHVNTHLAMYIFPCITDGVLLYVHTCKVRSQMSRTAESIALIFGTYQYLVVYRKKPVRRLGANVIWNLLSTCPRAG